MSDWARLIEELKQWKNAGLEPQFWWRDDDAVVDCEELQRLSSISSDLEIPLGLAVIPLHAEKSLCSVFDRNDKLFALQHGYSHNNYANADQRKMELSLNRPIEEICKDLSSGYSSLQDLLADRFYAVLVPPWNRFSEALVPTLSGLGFTGLSSRGPRESPRMHELDIVNIHVDIIDWKRRSFAGDAAVLAKMVYHMQSKREGRADIREATGLMSHHLVHDEATWEFLPTLLEVTLTYGGVWQNPKQLFTNQD